MASETFSNVPLKSPLPPPPPYTGESTPKLTFIRRIAACSWQTVTTEFTATFMFVYLGVGSIIACGLSPDSRIHSTSALLASGVSNGFALSVGVALGSTRGVGFCNPAVSMGYALVGRMSVVRAAILGAAQVAAAMAATGVASAIYPGSLSTNRLHVWSLERAYLLEAVVASILTIMSMSLRPKKGVQNPAAPVIMGFLMAACMVSTSPFADGTANPARSLAVAAFTSTWKDSWVHLTAPFCGASVGALIHEFMIEQPVEA